VELLRDAKELRTSTEELEGYIERRLGGYWFDLGRKRYNTGGFKQCGKAVLPNV